MNASAENGRFRQTSGVDPAVRAQTRETIFTALEQRIADGSIRGPRRRKMRRDFIRDIGRYLEGETDPGQRARLEAIVRGLEEADGLPAIPGNPAVLSARAAHLIRTGKA